MLIRRSQEQPETIPAAAGGKLFTAWADVGKGRRVHRWPERSESVRSERLDSDAHKVVDRLRASLAKLV